MIQALRRVLVAAERPIIRRLARLRVGLARRSASPAARRMLTAVLDTLDGKPVDEGRGWVDRIETLRASLESSEERIPLVDYGAGAPGETRTAEEMRKGIRLESTIGTVCRTFSKPPFWGRLLFNVVREFRPRRGIELGTCLAISAAYQGAALALAGEGTLQTLEGSESLVEQSRRNLASLGLSQVTVRAGRFEETLPIALRDLGAVDYAFIDGHHDEQATLAYFRQLLPSASASAIFVFDDIRWSEGMRRAWEAIVADERVRVAVDLRLVGLCLVSDPAVPKECLRFWLL